MIPVLIALPVVLAISVLLYLWLHGLHQELILLAWAVHRARERRDPAGLARAEEALERRLRRFPARALGRWMGISAPGAPGTPTPAR